MRVTGKVLGKGRQHAGPGLDQQDRRPPRIDAPEVARQGEAGEFGYGAGHLHAGRAAADHDRGHQPRPLFGIGRGLGKLERGQQPGADQPRIVDRLQAGGERSPIIMPEVGVSGPRGQDEPVVRHKTALPEEHASPARVHAGDLAEQHRDIAVTAQDPADRFRDVRGRQAGGGYLVEQRLEQVVVLTIDHRHPNRVAPQRLGRREPRESGTHDHDMWKTVGRSGTEVDGRRHDRLVTA